MRKVEPDELLTELGLSNSTTECWLDDRLGLARLARKSVNRRGAATRREVWHDWRVPLEAAGYEPAKIKDAILNVCEGLEELRDFVAVGIGREHGWVKAEPRWLKLDEEHAVLLGSVPPTTEKEVFDPADQNRADAVRRFSLSNVDDKQLEDVEPLTLNEWLGPAEWCQFVEDETERKHVGLSEFWEIQKSRLSQSSLTSDDENSTTFLCSGTGSYFGNFRSGTPSGRWQTVSDTDDGIFVGARKGFNENDWRYFLGEVNDHQLRNVVGLENYAELSWTLIAKGISTGNEEVWGIENRNLSFTFPPPKQLGRLCDLFGSRNGAWKWKLCSDFAMEKLTFWKSARR